MKNRSLFWDNYKGILILLVVFGHFIDSYAHNMPGSFVEYLQNFIYTFHMPAFIFCTGYFSKSERSRSVESLVKLFLYYAAFNTLMAFFAYYYMDTGFKLLTPYYAFWYILSVITWRACIGKLGNVKGLVLMALVITLALGFWSEFTNVLSLRRTVAFFVFFAAGYKLDKEKTEAFLSRRNPWLMAACAVFVLFAAGVAFWAVLRYSISYGMGLMSAYTDDIDLLRRVLVMVIAWVAIVGMFLVVPNRKIPLLSKMGRNSLLIFLVHRFITLVYYRDLFHYETYSHKYLLYALIATFLTCIIFSADWLNRAVAAVFDKAAAAVCNPGSRAGRWIIAMLTLLFTVLLCFKAAPVAMDLAQQLRSDPTTETTAPTEESAETVPMSTEEPRRSEEVGALTEEQEAAIENAVKIAYVGDLILLKDQITTAYDESTGSYDFSPMFEYIAPYLTDADLAVGVFEGTAAGEERGYSTSNVGDGTKLYLSYPDEFAQAIKDSGIDLVTTANNHLFDYGLDGAMRTLDVLDEVGLQHTGTYRNQEEKDTLLIVEAGGIRIAVLSYTYFVNDYPSIDFAVDYPYLTALMPYTFNPNYDRLVGEIAEDFAQAKASDADVIMVLSHMGAAYQTTVNEWQNKWNAIFAGLGADVVLSAHAQVVQPLEYIGDTLVVNCPGTLALSYVAYDRDASSLVEVYIDPDTKEVIAAGVVPMYIQEYASGAFRALPFYEMMTNDDLYNELWTGDKSRIQQLHPMITEIMLGEAVDLDDVQPRYFYPNSRCGNS